MSQNNKLPLWHNKTIINDGYDTRPYVSNATCLNLLQTLFFLIKVQSNIIYIIYLKLIINNILLQCANQKMTNEVLSVLFFFAPCDLLKLLQWKLSNNQNQKEISSH